MTQAPFDLPVGREPDRTARLFAAIWVPPNIADALARHLDARWPDWDGDPPSDPGSGRSQLRRTRADTWHVTLAFLGAAPLARTIRKFQGSSQAIPGTGLPPPGELQLAGGGNFGPVVWVGVAHDGWLATTAAAMQNRLAVTDRRFQAHVTVGRGRGPGRTPVEVARQAAGRLGDWRGPTWTPTEVLLVESILGPHPEYPIRSRIALD